MLSNDIVINHICIRKERNLSSYLIDGFLKDLAFVSLARAHVRGGNQLGKLIDIQVLLGPSSFFVKALVTVNNRNAELKRYFRKSALIFSSKRRMQNDKTTSNY